MASRSKRSRRLVSRVVVSLMCSATFLSGTVMGVLMAVDPGTYGHIDVLEYRRGVVCRGYVRQVGGHEVTVYLCPDKKLEADDQGMLKDLGT